MKSTVITSILMMSFVALAGHEGRSGGDTIIADD